MYVNSVWKLLSGNLETFVNYCSIKWNIFFSDLICILLKGSIQESNCQFTSLSSSARISFSTTNPGPRITRKSTTFNPVSDLSFCHWRIPCKPTCLPACFLLLSLGFMRKAGCWGQTKSLKLLLHMNLTLTLTRMSEYYVCLYIAYLLSFHVSWRM